MFFSSFCWSFPIIDDMKAKKFLLSFWLATASFCLLQIFAGPNGFLATAHLRSDLEALDARLEELAAVHNRLQVTYDALRTSSEAIRLEARHLGWFMPGEVPVKVVSGSAFSLPVTPYDMHQVLKSEPDPISEVFFRAAWPLLVVLYYGAFTLWELLLAREVLPPVLVPRGRNERLRRTG